MKKKLVLTMVLIGTFLTGVVVGKSQYISYSFLKSLVDPAPATKKMSTFTSFYVHKKSLYEILRANSTYKIAMLGDSITDWGEWNELFDRNDIINRGISGDSTDGVLKRIDGINSSVSKVFIMIGINDLSKGKSVTYVFNNYKKIVTLLKEKNMQPIIQSTLFVDPVKNHRVKNSDVEQLNNQLKKYAMENDLLYIDLNIKLSKDKKLRSDYSYDGLHLNGDGYKAWKEVLEPYLYQKSHCRIQEKVFLS